ncbi:EAL domain-containing protein [Oceanobacillus sp. CF4.6]|uniref:EAL domain-containing protein n=1 Tax=Oceanobacillus sp. CF4.6 TaxID=3373080 RepID=UPI003EE6C003
MPVTKIKDLIEQQQFFHHFQPIYNLTIRKKIGCEVLFRSNLIKNPEVVFQTALKVNLLYELEKRSTENAITSYSKSPYSPENGKLFINVFPSTLVNPDFPSFITTVLSKSKLH